MKDWSAVLPLVGVVLGWGFTQISAWLTTQQTDRRVVKEVIYFLLELYRLLRVMERLNTQLPRITATLKQYASTPPPEFQAAIDTLLERFLRAVITPVVTEQLAALKEGYNASLLKLATVDPINAYRLRGQEDTIRKIPQMLSVVQAAASTHLDTTATFPPEVASFFQQEIEPEDAWEAQALVLQVLKALAKKAGRATRRELAAVIATVNQADDELPNKLEQLMQKAITSFPPSNTH